MFCIFKNMNDNLLTVCHVRTPGKTLTDKRRLSRKVTEAKYHCIFSVSEFISGTNGRIWEIFFKIKTKCSNLIGFQSRTNCKYIKSDLLK